MNIRRTFTKIAGVRKESVDLDRPSGGNPPPLTALELEALSIHGDLLVQVGGTITPQTGSPLTLPSRQVRVPSDMPIQQDFSLSLSNSASLADAWYALVEDNIDTALVALLAKESGLSGTSVATLPLS